MVTDRKAENGENIYVCMSLDIMIASYLSNIYLYKLFDVSSS